MPTPPTSPLLGPPRDRVDLAHGGGSLLIAQLNHGRMRLDWCVEPIRIQKNHMLRRTERT